MSLRVYIIYNIFIKKLFVAKARLLNWPNYKMYREKLEGNIFFF